MAFTEKPFRVEFDTETGKFPRPAPWEQNDRVDEGALVWSVIYRMTVYI